MTKAETFWRENKRAGVDVLDALRELEENGIQFGYVTLGEGKMLETDVEAVRFDDDSVLLLHGSDLTSGEFPLPASLANRAGVEEVGDFQPLEGIYV